MKLRIALAGNPNCGKTTLFNALTGSNQYVGNWPGVTVEKKEGNLKKHEGIIITDLPGIYSLSPYTMEEVVARKYLINERPDAILNIIDGTNLERNLYLTTQLAEIGIPVVIAINMMDIVRKNGDQINIDELSKQLGCKIVELSALKEDGTIEAAEAAIEAAKSGKIVPMHTFSGPVEHALAHIEEAIVHDLPEEQQRWYAIKVFERDSKVIQQLKLTPEQLSHVEKDIVSAEKELDDDAESIITNERYNYITSITQVCYHRHNADQLTISDKIDRIVTNRVLGLPVFAAIMFLVYYVSMVTIGAAATDWTNDHLFGEGFHLFGIGAAEYSADAEGYEDAENAVRAYYELDPEAPDFDADTALQEMSAITGEASRVITLTDEETLQPTDYTVYYDSVPRNTGNHVIGISYREAVGYFRANGFEAPAPAEYGKWVPGIPVVIGNLLEKANAAEWLRKLILDGIVEGVGAVLGFVPQMLVLFFMLAFLEACGYMSRIAFVLDRVFRKFGLSGKSFIPMLIGTGCSVPGVMASRTIESEQDRRMTVITTSFIPCGAKVPFISMIAGAIFGGSAWVATSAYFIGMAAVIVSGVMLKKTPLFVGKEAAFVMELPAYHMPTLVNVLRATWDRGWSFIKKAGTVILLSTVIIFFMTYFGTAPDGFRMLGEQELEYSILAKLGSAIAWIFIPLGWGNWQSTVAALTGLVAKENIVGTLGVLYGGGDANVWQTLCTAFTGVTAYSYLVFNLLCAPCIAAISAIRREMRSAKWTLFAIGYQCTFAYAVALIINQFGNLLTGHAAPAGLLFASAVLLFMLYMLFIRKPLNQKKG